MRVRGQNPWQRRQLAFLDAADPPPRRDEARFAGDYKAFRAAFQAWDCRERRRRKKVQLHDADAADVPAGAEHEMPNTKPAKRKYRSMLPRPRREAFDTEEDFEDAMAERGAARDVRRRASRATFWDPSQAGPSQDLFLARIIPENQGVNHTSLRRRSRAHGALRANFQPPGCCGLSAQGDRCHKS